MKKSPQLISTSPIVPSVVFVLTNPLLFRKIFKDRSMRLIVEFSIIERFNHLPRNMYIYIYIGTKQGLVSYITFHSNLDGNHDFAKYH